jgi:ribonuclease Z
VDAWLYVLGSSAAVPMRGRGLPCYAFIYRGVVVLLDVGEGCQHRMVEAGVSPLRVELIAVTHAHGDHLFGLPGLLHTMNLMGRAKPLTIVGPRQVIDYVRAITEVAGRPGFELKLVEAREGVTLELAGLRLRPFPVKHTIEAYGYTIEEPPRLHLKLDILRRLGVKPGPWISKLRQGEPVSINGVRLNPEDVFAKAPGIKLVYTGDTRPLKRVVEEARGATLLVHDATFTLKHAEKAYEEGHSTAADAGLTAMMASAQLLVLTHFSARYDDPYEHVSEAKRYHPFVIAAEDYLKIPIQRSRTGSSRQLGTYRA